MLVASGEALIVLNEVCSVTSPLVPHAKSLSGSPEVTSPPEGRVQAGELTLGAQSVGSSVGRWGLGGFPRSPEFYGVRLH